MVKTVSAPHGFHDDDFDGAVLGAHQLIAAIAQGKEEPYSLLGDEGEEGEEESRAYAEETPPRPGLILRPSASNPEVKRWVKVRAQQYVASRRNEVAEEQAKFALGATALAHGTKHLFKNDPEYDWVSPTAHVTAALTWGLAAHSAGTHLLQRNKGRWGVAHSDDATHHEHYLQQHAETVKHMAKRTGLSERTVANAMAFWGRHHLKAAHESGERARMGKDRVQQHKKLGNKAVESMQQGIWGGPPKVLT